MENEVLILGLDDAGRGCLIGNMVLSGVIIKKEIEQELKELGTMDSKLLTKKKREKLVGIIKEKVISYDTQMATPSEIDTGMGIGLNLNQIEALEAGLIINNLTKNLNTEQKSKLRIIVDCPSNNREGWKSQMLEYIEDKTLNIRCEHKADRDHVAVSAASIISKVTRDAEIKKLHEKIGIDFGSGYPNDPKTKDFLKKYVKDKKIRETRIFRESWATFQNALEGKKQMKLPDY